MVLGGCLAIAITCTVLLAGNRNDDAFVTYRYAQNLAAGRGFVFNPGEAVLGTSAPYHGLAIALLGLTGMDLVLAAQLISLVATVVLGTLLWTVLARSGEPWAGVIAAATILVNLFTYEVAPLETVLVTALCWGALAAMQRSCLSWVGVLSGLAIGVRGDAALWVLVVIASGLIGRHDRRRLLLPALAGGAVLAPWVVFAWSYYGDPLSSSAAAKIGWPGHGWLFLSELWDRGLARLAATPGAAIVVVALAVVGTGAVFRRERLRPLRALPVWVVAYVLVYSALRVFWPHRWYYYPLVVVAAVLFAVGSVEAVRFVRGQVRPAWWRIMAPASLVVVLFGLGGNAAEIASYRAAMRSEFSVGGRDRLYRLVARWLRENTAATTKVAMCEPGTVAYHADRSMVDMMGLVTPQAAAFMKRTSSRHATIEWTVQRFSPDVFVLHWPVGRPPQEVLPSAPSYVLEKRYFLEDVPLGLLVYARP